MDADLVGVERKVTRQARRDAGRSLESHAGVAHEQPDPAVTGGQRRAADIRVERDIVGHHRDARHSAARLDADRREELSGEREGGADRRRADDRHLVAVVAGGVAEGDTPRDINVTVGEAALESDLNVEPEVVVIEQFTDLVLGTRHVGAQGVGDGQGRARSGEELMDDEFHAARGGLVAGLDDLEPQVARLAEESLASGEPAADALIGDDRELVARVGHEVGGEGDRDGAVEDGLPRHGDLIGAAGREREFRAVVRLGGKGIDLLRPRLTRRERGVGLRLGRIFGDDRIDRVDVHRAREGAGRHDAACHGDR